MIQQIGLDIEQITYPFRMPVNPEAGHQKPLYCASGKPCSWT